LQAKFDADLRIEAEKQALEDLLAKEEAEAKRISDA